MNTMYANVHLICIFFVHMLRYLREEVSLVAVAVAIYKIMHYIASDIDIVIVSR